MNILSILGYLSAVRVKLEIALASRTAQHWSASRSASNVWVVADDPESMLLLYAKWRAAGWTKPRLQAALGAPLRPHE